MRNGDCFRPLASSRNGAATAKAQARSQILKSGLSASDPIADTAGSWLNRAMSTDDEARFDERVKALVMHKPVEKPE
jgi:hypothetical protein